MVSRSGHNETVAALLKNRADVTIQDDRGRVSSDTNSTLPVNKLAKGNITYLLTESFQTSLHTASHNGHSNTVTMLLEHEETEINKMDNNGEVGIDNKYLFRM